MKDSKIYSDCYQLTIQILHRTKNFPKALRPTLGRKMEEMSLSCLVNSKKALIANSENRLKFLYEISSRLDELKIYIQVAKDMEAINVAALSELSELTKEIGKELGGFIKYEMRKTNTAR